MSSFNKAILIGRLTRDPELKYTPQGSQLAKFGLAVDRRKSKNDETDFFNIVAWGKLAEICGQYLKKGKLVLIEGEIQTRKYETQDGQKKSSFEIFTTNMQMLDRKGEGGEYGGGSSGSSPQKKAKSGARDDFDDITVDSTDVDEFDAEDMPF
jgi:single-strand DNA-binding protein